MRLDDEAAEHKKAMRELEEKSSRTISVVKNIYIYDVIHSLSFFYRLLFAYIFVFFSLFYICLINDMEYIFI
jgi:hypothetical protein